MKKFLLGLVIALCQLSLVAQTNLPTSWTFINPSPSDDSTNAPLGWKTRLNILVTGTTPFSYATGSDGNAACRLDAQGEYVQISFTESPGNLSYYLRGTSISAPAFQGSFRVQESANGINWTDLRNHTSMNSSFTKYIETPNNSSRFIRFFYQSKVSGSNVALDSVLLNKAGPGKEAKISLVSGGSKLVNGSSLVIGNIAATRFTIQNEGLEQTLAFSSINISGINASDFSIGTLPDSLAPLDTFSFFLNLNLSTLGSKFAKLTLLSNSIENSSFDLNIYGISGSFATEPNSQPTQLSFTNVKAYGFTVGFVNPISPTENYLVLQKEDNLVTDAPLDGQTYKKGDYIGASKVAYVGPSSVFNSNNVGANKSYYYAIFSFNGPPSYENYLTSNPLKGSVKSSNASIGNYYSGVTPGDSNFISQLTSKINPHDTIFYSNYSATLVNPWLARDTSGGKKVVTCVYTNHQFLYNEPFLWANGNNGAVLTREHTWPQSWMPSNAGNPDWPNAIGTTKELPEYNDLHNLFPAHQANANARRSNNPFDEVVTPTYTSPTGFGVLGKDSANRTAYEPRAEQKGDIARALFYMATCYNGINGLNWAIPSNQNLALLREWHRQDPPDNMEIARNEFIAITQGNRNPFIDFPEWADRINFSTMGFIPGDSIPPLPKLIKISSPSAGDKWKKGVESSISFSYQNIDSVVFLFSTDSMKTWTNLLGGNTAISTSNNPFLYTPTDFFNHPTGILIIKDISSTTSDTSAYISLEIPNGLMESFGSNQINVYPNPANEFIKVETRDFKISKVSILDLQGREVLESSTQELNIIQLLPGSYILKIKSGSTFVFKKFQKL
jgi:endonuclease I